MSHSDAKVAVQVEGRTLTLTNLGKVLYPQAGFTKAEVLSYYQRVAPLLLPHIADRPVTLKRYPEGVDGEAFFQKHVTAHRPDWIRTARVDSESSRARELCDRTSCVRTQPGRWAVTCFWKKDWPSTPSGYRLSVIGRPAMCGSSTPAARW